MRIVFLRKYSKSFTKSLFKFVILLFTLHFRKRNFLRNDFLYVSPERFRSLRVTYGVVKPIFQLHIYYIFLRFTEIVSIWKTFLCEIRASTLSPKVFCCPYCYCKKGGRGAEQFIIIAAATIIATVHIYTSTSCLRDPKLICLP